MYVPDKVGGWSIRLKQQRTVQQSYQAEFSPWPSSDYACIEGNNGPAVDAIHSLGMHGRFCTGMPGCACNSRNPVCVGSLPFQVSCASCERVLEMSACVG